jgi:hypothetical protein
MHVGITTGHGGFVQQYRKSQNSVTEIVDYSNNNLSHDETYPDFIIPSAQHIFRKKVK